MKKKKNPLEKSKGSAERSEMTARGPEFSRKRRKRGKLFLIAPSTYFEDAEKVRRTTFSISYVKPTDRLPALA